MVCRLVGQKPTYIHMHINRRMNKENYKENRIVLDSCCGHEIGKRKKTLVRLYLTDILIKRSFTTTNVYDCKGYFM